MSTTTFTMPQLATTLTAAATGRFDGESGLKWFSLNTNNVTLGPIVQTLTDTQLVIAGQYAYDAESGSISVDITIGSSDNSCSISIAIQGGYDNAQLSDSGFYTVDGESYPTVTFHLNSGTTVVMDVFKPRFGWAKGVEFTWNGSPFCFENTSGEDGSLEAPRFRGAPTQD